MYAINNIGGVDTLTPAQLEQANELNKADIGVASAAAVNPPFLAGQAAQTHTGRTSAVAAKENIEPADKVQMQKAASQSDAYKASVTPSQNTPE